MTFHYRVYHLGSIVGEFDTYPLANQGVLDHSRQQRIWDAVGYSMRSTKSQLTRVLALSTTPQVRCSEFGQRATAFTSWASLYHALHTAHWWVQRGTSLHLTLRAEFNNGRECTAPFQLGQPTDGEGHKHVLSYSDLFRQFDTIASICEITSFATDWPQNLPHGWV